MWGMADAGKSAGDRGNVDLETGRGTGAPTRPRPERGNRHVTQPAGTSNPAERNRPLSPREVMIAMSGLAVTILLAQLDNLIVAPALPTISGELHGLNHLAWVTTGYIVAATASTPVWGKLGDLYGRRLTVLASILLFLFGSALCGLSQTMNELIGFRALQGIGAGGLMVGVVAAVGDLVPPRQRGKYQGMLMAVSPAAIIGGPLIGGFVTDHFTWRWVFYLNLPLGIAALALCSATLRKLPPGNRSASVDWLGTVLLITWITALVLITNWAGTQYTWGSWQILALAAVTVVVFIVFIAVERRVREPVMPLKVFKDRNFTFATLLGFLNRGAMFGAIVFLPQFQQFIQGASATSSGLLLTPMMIASTIVAPLRGAYVSRTGRYRTPTIVGSALMAVSLAMFSTMNTSTPPLLTTFYLVLLGISTGSLMSITTIIAQNSVPLRDLGAATGASTFLRNMGGSLGISIMGSIYAIRLTDYLSAHGAGKVADAADAASLTPQALHHMPEATKQVFQAAVTSGTDFLFRWAALLAICGFIVSWFIRHVPLDDTTPAPEPTTAASETSMSEH
jgi:EmrB/QacA subfamily drug resistance transporter